MRTLMLGLHSYALELIGTVGLGQIALNSLFEPIVSVYDTTKALLVEVVDSVAAWLGRLVADIGDIGVTLTQLIKRTNSVATTAMKSWATKVIDAIAGPNDSGAFRRLAVPVPATGS